MGLADQLQKFSGGLFTDYDQETGQGLERRVGPTAAELREGTTAEPIPATYPHGVVYFADHETLDDGIARQARLHARALHDAGVAVRLQTISNRIRVAGQWHFPAGEEWLAPSVLEQVGELRRATIASPGLFVRHVVLTDAPSLRHICLPGYLKEDPRSADRVLARTVLYVPFESDRLTPELADVIARMGQVWLQCSRNISVFEEAGVPPRLIRCIPNAYDPATPAARIAAERPVPPSGKRFLNIGKWEPRKAQHELFGAFLLAYGPNDPATLLVKTSGFGGWQNYPEGPGQSLGFWLNQAEVKARGWTAQNLGSRVHVETKTMTDEEIGRLHVLTNIYVSASHGEGWDYPAFDAVLAGNSLVHVGFGGSEDYAWPSSSGLTWTVPYRLRPVHPGYVEKFGWHKDARWADFEFGDLVRALKAAAPPARREKPSYIDAFATESAGKRMRAGIEVLAKQHELEPPWRHDG